ncbi:MAG: glycosyltransferase [Deltaproteobacteria bacterium]|nr:glycosyltransferase [Deltaproteobacteria bacterium]
MKNSNSPTYCVFLICRNNEDTLKKSLPIILSQCRSKNIIAFDTQSEDNTKALLKEVGIKVINIKKGEFNHGRTRNLSLKYSNAEIFIFLNGDAIPLDNWLDALLSGIEDCDAVFSKQIPSEDCDPLRFTDLVNHPYFRFSKVLKITSNSNLPVVFDTVSCAVRRATLQRIKFPTVPFGEDYLWAELLINCGGTISYIPQSIVIHSHSIYTDTRKIIKRHFEEGRLKSHHKKEYGLRYTFGFIPSAFILDTITLLTINIPMRNRVVWIMKEPFLRTIQLISFHLGLNQERIPPLLKDMLSWSK